MTDSVTCYICKRTEKEVQEFLLPQLEPILNQYDSEIFHIKSNLQNMETELKAYLEGILKDIGQAPLEFTIETVKSEIGSFKEIIPRLDDLLQFRDDIRVEMKTFSDIRQTIKEVLDEINSGTIVEHKYYYAEKLFSRDPTNIDVWDNSYIQALLVDEHGNKTTVEPKEIVKLLEYLEKLTAKRTAHLATLEQQKQNIGKLKHYKFSRKVTPSIEYTPPENDDPYDSKRYEEIFFTVPICSICYTLVWHDFRLTEKYSDSFLVKDDLYFGDAETNKKIQTLKNNQYTIEKISKPSEAYLEKMKHRF